MKIVILLLIVCNLLLADINNAITTLKMHGRDFQISKEILAKYDILIKMILATESMDDDDRQYWFDILPSMKDEQINSLYNILEKERKKLQILEKKYQKEIKVLNEKNLKEWIQMTYDQKFNFLETMHKEEKNIDQMNREELLNSL